MKRPAVTRRLGSSVVMRIYVHMLLTYCIRLRLGFTSSLYNACIHFVCASGIMEYRTLRVKKSAALLGKKVEKPIII
jgi:hypothetical protein